MTTIEEWKLFGIDSEDGMSVGCEKEIRGNEGRKEISTARLVRKVRERRRKSGTVTTKTIKSPKNENNWVNVWPAKLSEERNEDDVKVASHYPPRYYFLFIFRFPFHLPRRPQPKSVHSSRSLHQFSLHTGLIPLVRNHSFHQSQSPHSWLPFPTSSYLHPSVSEFRLIELFYFEFPCSYIFFYSCLISSCSTIYANFLTGTLTNSSNFNFLSFSIKRSVRRLINDDDDDDFY